MGLRTVVRPFSDRRVRRSVFAMLKGNVLCSMATIDPRRRAHISTAYFCYSEDLELYFLSDPGSLHCRDLAANPSMAMAIFSSSQRWGDSDRGMQLFGRCTEAKGRTAAEAERLYGRRFPRFTRWLRGAGAADRHRATALRSYRFYRFVPARVKILDEAEFGGGVFVLSAVRRLRAKRPQTSHVRPARRRGRRTRISAKR